MKKEIIRIYNPLTLYFSTIGYYSCASRNENIRHAKYLVLCSSFQNLSYNAHKMFVNDLYEYSNIELLQRVRLTNPHYRTSVARLDRLFLVKYTTAIVRKCPISYSITASLPRNTNNPPYVSSFGIVNHARQQLRRLARRRGMREDERGELRDRRVAHGSSGSLVSLCAMRRLAGDSVTQFPPSPRRRPSTWDSYASMESRQLESRWLKPSSRSSAVAFDRLPRRHRRRSRRPSAVPPPPPAEPPIVPTSASTRRSVRRTHNERDAAVPSDRPRPDVSSNVHVRAGSRRYASRLPRQLCQLFQPSRGSFSVSSTKSSLVPRPPTSLSRRLLDRRSRRLSILKLSIPKTVSYCKQRLSVFEDSLLTQRGFSMEVV